MPPRKQFWVRREVLLLPDQDAALKRTAASLGLNVNELVRALIDDGLREYRKDRTDG
jgi:hypothetical protein